MRLLTVFLALTLSVPPSLFAQEINIDVLTGDWKGDLQTGSIELPLVLHFKRDSSGQLISTLDSPLQNAYGIKADPPEAKGDRFTVMVPAVKGSLSFRIDTARQELEGIWRQGGLELPIILKRMMNEESVFSRPQMPKEPFPYLTREVTFKNEKADIMLAATLTLPDSLGRYPGVVLISGSGPQDRDESILGHKPFLVLADYLTRHGIAVLRYDDRGTGKSQGFFALANTFDLAEDAKAAHRYLQNHQNIRAGCTGIIGHSEGGMIAPIVSNTDSSVNFIISIAGPSIPGDSLLLLQTALIAEKSGRSPYFISLNRKLQRKIFGIIKEAQKRDEDLTALRIKVSKAMEALSPAEKDTLGLTPQVIVQQTQTIISPWMRTFIAYDPTVDLTKLRVPILSIYGEKDVQVPAPENSSRLESILQNKSHPDYRVLVFPDLNHLMQHAESGLPAEYGKIEETMAPEVLQTIKDWIILHCK